MRADWRHPKNWRRPSRRHRGCLLLPGHVLKAHRAWRVLKLGSAQIGSADYFFYRTHFPLLSGYHVVMIANRPGVVGVVETSKTDAGLQCLTLLQRFHQVALDPTQIAHEFSIAAARHA